MTHAYVLVPSGQLVEAQDIALEDTAVSVNGTHFLNPSERRFRPLSRRTNEER